MKTVQDYLNDPRILNDPYMTGALETIKEIHAIRLLLQDERAGMSLEEEIEYLNKKAEAFLAPMGKTLCYDLIGQGKIDKSVSIIAPIDDNYNSRQIGILEGKVTFTESKENKISF